MFRNEYDLTLPEGGSLRVREWGDPTGPMAIFHHGTPSSSAAVPGGWESAAQGKFWMHSFDRPGYGHSPRAQGRSILDAASWSAAIADHLGRERFAVMGTSGGGPHAAATAAALPDRVTALGLIVSLGPYSEPNDEVPGLPKDTAAEAAAARQGEASLRSFIDALGSPEESLDGWYEILPPSDREILSRHVVRSEEKRENLEWAVQGVDGWVDDDLALFSRSWGFDPAGISVPTRILYGAADVLVPAMHAEAWQRAIPHAESTAIELGGHWLRDDEPALLQELLRLSA